MSHRHALVDPQCKHKWPKGIRTFSMDGGDLGRGSGPVYMCVECNKPEPCDGLDEPYVLPCSGECCERLRHHTWLPNKTCEFCKTTRAREAAAIRKHRAEVRAEERRCGEAMKRFEKETVANLEAIFARYGIKKVDKGLLWALTEEIKDHVEWY